MVQLLRNLRVVVGLAVLAMAPVAADAADPTASRTERLAGPALALTGAADRLTVTVEARPDVEVSWRGPRRWVEAQTPRQQGSTARLDTRAAGVAMTTVVADGITATVIGSGTAQVTIGGREIAAGGSSGPETEITVRMPAGADLDLSGAWGQCRLGKIGGRLDLTVVNGTCAIAGIGGGGVVTLSGSGSADIAEAAADLDLTIAGSGDIRVRRAALGRLTARIDGNGTIEVGGSAARADLVINGAGDIRVDRVTERPRTAVNGAGSIEVGNWR